MSAAGFMLRASLPKPASPFQTSDATARADIHLQSAHSRSSDSPKTLAWTPTARKMSGPSDSSRIPDPRDGILARLSIWLSSMRKSNSSSNGSSTISIEAQTPRHSLRPYQTTPKELALLRSANSRSEAMYSQFHSSSSNLTKSCQCEIHC